MGILTVHKRNIIVKESDLSKEEMVAAIEKKEIGWDIETSGLDWHNDKIGTCQINIPDVGVVIVQIGKKVPKHLCRLLMEKGIKKVFHHAMFDLRFMSYQWDVMPENIACTKIAAKLLDIRNQKGTTLKMLLDRYLGVQINKKQRLSNWRAHELTKEQIYYAAHDVMYLLTLLTELEKELKRKKLLALGHACFEHIPTRVRLDICGYSDVYEY